MGAYAYATNTPEDFAEKFRGNWQHFDSFGWDRQWNGDIQDPENWGIFYTGGRDSGIIAESNEQVIRTELQDFIGEDVLEEDHRHWAHGYVTGFSVRVYGDDGEFTPAFMVLYDLVQRVESYPLLDEDDYTQREHDEEIQYIENYGRPRGLEYIDDLPDDWAHEVHCWLSDTHYYFSHNDGGAYLHDGKEAMREALLTLGFAYNEDEEADD